MKYFQSSMSGYLAVMLCFSISSCTPNKTETLLQPSKALGIVLAEEAMRAAGANKTIVLISPDARWGPTSTVEKELKSALQAQGFSITIAKSAYLGDPMTMGKVGLKPEDLFEAVQNAAGAGAIVSLAGAPLMTPDSAAQLKPGHPPILAVAIASLGEEPGLPGNRVQLESLLEAKVIQLAIVNGAETGAPASAKTDPAHELFVQNYRILRQPP